MIMSQTVVFPDAAPPATPVEHRKDSFQSDRDLSIIKIIHIINL